MPAADYRRTPLPPAAQTPLGWLALWMCLLSASPFIGFALHGQVGEAGLATGVALAVLPLSGLAWLALRRWRGMRKVPRDVLQTWRHGRIVPAEGAPAVASPARFSHRNHWIELRPEGLALSRAAWLGMPGAAHALAQSWVAEQSGQLFMPWRDVEEWAVESDSDGPDSHRLKLRAGGSLAIRRFLPEQATECDLLDAVRGIGRLPVRLRCDVDCGGRPGRGV